MEQLQMKNPLKSTGLFLADPAAAIFGIVVFNYVWVWVDSPAWAVEINIIWATLLLIASLLLLANKAWSNLVAAILGGFGPLLILQEFMMLAHNAEVPVFNHEHFDYVFTRMQLTSKGLLSIGLDFLILSRAVFALLRLTRARK
jgi:hypothetical protein